MQKNKSLLLVCWDFPPNDGIGGRRWAKFAKELVKQGYYIYVICKEKEPNEKVSTWFKDVDLVSIERIYLKQKLLSKYLSNYNNPLKVKLATWLLKLMYNGTIYDKTLGLENEFLTVASKLIKEKEIETIIATGAPFNLLVYATKLKVLFKNIKIIADYRDPWITAENYGMKELNNKRRNFEKEKQNFVFENVSFVTCPNKFLLSEIKSTYSGERNSLATFVELLHFYDEDDKLDRKEQLDDRIISFIYGGAIYLNSDKHLKLLNDAIAFYKSSNTTEKLKFEFFTNDVNKSFLFNNNKDVISFNKPIGEKIFEKIIDCNFVIILLADHNKDYLTSKFFEFLPYNKKYFFVGPAGYVSNFIEERKMGHVLKYKEDLANAIKQMDQHLDKPDIAQYSLKAVTKVFLDQVLL